MRQSKDDINLLKTCPRCEALILISAMDCSFCGYVYEPIVLSDEEEKWSYSKTIEMINDAFFRLESYGNGNTGTYKPFDFGRLFSVLFKKTQDPDNQSIKNFRRIENYYALTGQIATDYDKNHFENRSALENEGFVADLEALTYINSGRYWEFIEFETPNKAARISIADILDDDEPIFGKASDGDEETKLAITDFFDKVRVCSLTELERYNLTQKLTDNFDLFKLKLLLKDLDYYLFMEKEEMESRFSYEEIEEAIIRHKQKGLQVPTIKLPRITLKNRKGEEGEEPAREVVDVEGLLFSAEFFCCYQFKALLKSKIASLEGGGIANEHSEHIKEIGDGLAKYGFLQLDSIKRYSSEGQNKVLELMASKDIPFAIALLDQLDFIAHVSNNVFKTKVEMHKKLAAILKCPERTIKGNINVLNGVSKEDRLRYTAHLHISDARKIIENLK